MSKKSRFAVFSLPENYVARLGLGNKIDRGKRLIREYDPRLEYYQDY